MLQLTPVTLSMCISKCSFYIVQYPIRWTAQSALHFLPPLVDLFILASQQQGWGRLQKPDYDYDYSAHKIIDYDYSGD